MGNDYIQSAEDALLHTYNRYQIVLKKGEGAYLYDVDGKEYLLEKPLRANVAIIRGSIVDETGNVYYNGTTRNFNPLVAAAADVVIVEAEKLVKAGEINPEHVMTPGILVDYIVLEGGKN